MDLTGPFTWEDLPTTDADTGNSMAGWIPRISVFEARAATAVSLFHFSQTLFRIVKSHNTTFPSLYPSHGTISSIYELDNSLSE
jgi:hypothetical protein